MAKIDELKEVVGLFKFALGVVIGIFLAVIGWTATNYDKAPSWMFIANTIIFVFCLIAIVVILKQIKKRIKQIGEM